MTKNRPLIICNPCWTRCSLIVNMAFCLFGIIFIRKKKKNWMKGIRFQLEIENVYRTYIWKEKWNKKLQTKCFTTNKMNGSFVVFNDNMFNSFSYDWLHQLKGRLFCHSDSVYQTSFQEKPNRNSYHFD